VEAQDGDALVVPDPLLRPCPVYTKRLIVTRGKRPIKSAVPRPGLRGQKLLSRLGPSPQIRRSNSPPPLLVADAATPRCCSSSPPSLLAMTLRRCQGLQPLSLSLSLFLSLALSLSLSLARSLARSDSSLPRPPLVSRPVDPGLLAGKRLPVMKHKPRGASRPSVASLAGKKRVSSQVFSRAELNMTQCEPQRAASQPLEVKTGGKKPRVRGGEEAASSQPVTRSGRT
jgi:hypothetical protein